MTDTNNDRITKEDVVALIIRRQNFWINASVVIANMFPAVWHTLEEYIAGTQGMTDILLMDLQYDPFDEVLVYDITERDGDRHVKVPIPLSLVIKSDDCGKDVFEHLCSLPIPTSESDDDEFAPAHTPLDKIKRKLRQTMKDHPGLFLDIDRLAELELQAANGKFFKYSIAETLQ